MQGSFGWTDFWVEFVLPVFNILNYVLYYFVK